MRLKETVEDGFIIGVAEGDLIEFVLIHELIEDIRAKHHGLRYNHLNTFSSMTLLREVSAVSSVRASTL